MSLVLEALKKLDREKGRDERGFVVMAAAPWPTRAARRWPAWAALGVAVAGGVAALLAVRAQRAPAPATAISSAPLASATAPIAVVPAPATRIGRSSATGVAAVRSAPRAAATGAVPKASPAPHAGLRLQAVSERDGQPIAIVNDRLVRVGDEVLGMRVLAIRATEVDVEIKGHRTTLRF